MRVRRMWAGVAALTLMAGVGVGFAAPASAAQVWHQGVERASATAACPTSSEADLAIGWSQWAASWAQWANDGKGGFVCDRSIVWAKDTPPPGASEGDAVVNVGCVVYAETGDDVFYVNFGDSWALPYGADMWRNVADCSGAPYATIGLDVVYAPAGTDAAARCSSAFPGTTVGTWPDGLGPDIAWCARDR